MKTLFTLCLTIACLGAVAQPGKAYQDSPLTQIRNGSQNTAGDSVPISPASQKGIYHPVTPRSFIMPGAIFAAGAALTFGNTALHALDSSTQGEIHEDLPTYRTIIDNFLQFAPALTVFGLNAAGVKGKHSLRQSTEYYVIALILMAGSTQVLKNLTHVERPDQSDFKSFPSGHTANAFMGAEFLNQEYGFRSAWYPIAGYTAASATGVLRMANNRHWVGDVIAGAGIGILSTRVSYWLVPKINKVFQKKKTPAQALLL